MFIDFEGGDGFVLFRYGYNRGGEGGFFSLVFRIGSVLGLS